MIEGRRIGCRRGARRLGRAGEVLRDRDQIFNRQISVSAQRLDLLEICRAGKEERIIDRDQIAVVMDQGADLIDQSRITLRDINDALCRRRINRGIEKDAIETLSGSFQAVDLRPKISRLKISFIDRKPIQRIRGLGDVQKLAVQIQVDDA
jgi:hypothetical protein